MKSKLTALLAAMIIASCGLFVACKHEETPPTEQKDPVYVELTYEEFIANAEEFTVHTNYISNVLGYKLDFTVNESNDQGSTSNRFDALVDVSDFEDVRVSATLITNSTMQKKPSSGNNGSDSDDNGSQPMAALLTSRKEINVYLYDHTLYVDVTENAEATQKDSITDINNNLYDLLGDYLTSSDSDLELPFDLPSGFTKDDIKGMIEYFKDYTTITYCEELGHYILDTDYLMGGVYDGTEIDRFTNRTDLYVKNNRIITVKVKYVSDEIKVDGYLTEYSGSIEFPADPSSYSGTILDELEELYYNRNMTISDYCGEWTGDDNVYNYLLSVSEDKITLTITVGENSEVRTFETFQVTATYLIFAGELYDEVVTYTVHYNLSDGTLTLTLPDGVEVELVKNID